MGAGDAPDSLAVDLGCGVDDLKTVIARGLQAGKHNEFHKISKHLGLEPQHSLYRFASAVFKTHALESSQITLSPAFPAL